MRAGVCILLFLCVLGCSKRAVPPPPASRATVTVAAALPSPAVPKPVFVDTLPVPGDQPVFVLRGGREDGAVGVVLHGWCSHGMGFLQAFALAAAEVGQFIALQGDHHCGAGPMRGWTNDVVGLDRRIDAALRVYLGHEPPAEVLLVGSSQGVERAVDLARRFPGKYRRMVLGSGPHEVTASGLSQLAGVYFLVGQHEGRGVAQRSRAALSRAGLRAQLKIIEHAGHSDFQGQGNPLLKDAFDFLGVWPVNAQLR